MNIPFSKVTTGREEIDAVSRVIKSGWLAAGPETEAFEKEFSDYISPKGEHYYCIFTSSCTSALKMAYKWYRETTPDYRTITVPRNTFCATYAAADEIFGDCEEYGWIFEDEIPDRRVKYDRVNVHYGSVKDETPCLIEDSAHRIEPNDPLVGKIRCYSFYATKNMTTGSGGMLVTNDKEIYEKERLYWKDGLTTSTRDRLAGNPFYRVEVSSGGYDGNDIAAAIGRVQLKKLPEFTRRRNEIRNRYNEALGQDWAGNHLYPYFVNEEPKVKKLIEYLKGKGIASGYHYPGTGWLGVSLPIYPSLTDEEVEYIISSVRGWRER